MYLSVAEAVLGSDSGPETTAATGNAVLAGIAAADAACCALIGERSRDPDHRRAVDLLLEATDDRGLASALQYLIDLKDAAHYAPGYVKPQQAKAAVRRATQLVEAAREAV